MTNEFHLGDLVRDGLGRYGIVLQTSDNIVKIFMGDGTAIKALYDANALEHIPCSNLRDASHSTNFKEVIPWAVL